MTVKETLGALGSWDVELAEDTPDYILDRLVMFGHVGIFDGPVDIERTADADLLANAKYVGVMRHRDRHDGRTFDGSGLVFWLGDEDGKGHVLEDELDLSGLGFTAAVTGVLNQCPSVSIGDIESGVAGVMPDNSKYRYMSPRQALQAVCDAFGREFRVNSDASVDAGSAAYLYNVEAPDTILVRKGAGADLDLVALGADFETEDGGFDYTTRVVLLGQTTGTADVDPEPFATGSAEIDPASNPYRDLKGNPAEFTRLISESSTPEGSAEVRAQLQLNRFARLTRSLKIDVDDFDFEGNFVVGDHAFVYDPDTGIVNAANEVAFQGQIWHPESIRITEYAWPIRKGHSVGYRAADGTWTDLTPFVVWDTSDASITIGDLPATLSKPGDDPIQTRVDATRGNTGPDQTIPMSPTELTLVTFSSLDATGQTVSIINAEWVAPTLNEDGSVLTDLSHYLVQYRWVERAPAWQQAPVTEETGVDLIVSPGLIYNVRVAAVDSSGHVSAWTPVEIITSALDEIAPAAPADPEVTSYLGQLRIRYIGTDADGNPMPTDTDHIRVDVGDTAGFVPDDSTAVADLNPFIPGVAYATAPYGVTKYVVLSAVDRDGNVSEFSAHVAGTTVRVNDGDIQALNVGKLVSGTVSADVVVAGQFTTALLGQRTALNAAGLQAWRSDGTKTIDLNGASNLLMGKYMTDVVGQRRIEIGAAGLLGEIDFFAPDGRQAFVRAYTESTGKEAIQLGIVTPGVENPSLWNRINYNAQLGGGEYATYRSGTHEFIFDKGTPNFGRFVVFDTVARDVGNTNARFEIADETIQFWDSNGDQRFLLDDNNMNWYGVDAVQRPRITFQKTDGYFIVGTENPNVYFEIQALGTTTHRMGDGFGDVRFLRGDTDNGAKIISANGSFVGTMMRSRFPSGGTLRWEFRDTGDTTYVPLWASAFTVNSDRAAKKAIKAAPGGALAKVLGLSAREYERVTPETAKGQKHGKRREIGFIADEVAEIAPEIVLPDDGTGAGIDLYGSVVLLAQALQEAVTEMRSK